MERYRLSKVCDLAESNFPRYTHKQWMYAAADTTHLASGKKNLEDAGEEDNGTVILSFTGSDAKEEEEEEKRGKEGNLVRKGQRMGRV